MYSKDLVTNTSTGLMAIKDLATFNDVPINIHFDKHWIHIIVGFGTPYQRQKSYYTQDSYKIFGETDSIYNQIEEMVNEVKEYMNEGKKYD